MASFWCTILASDSSIDVQVGDESTESEWCHHNQMLFDKCTYSLLASNVFLQLPYNTILVPATVIKYPSC